MIVNGIADLRRYCPAVIISEDRDTFDDAIAVAEDLVEHDILGAALHAALEEAREDTPLRIRAARAIALQAFHGKISSVDVVLHDTGFGVENSEAFQAASRTRIEALKENTQRERDDAFSTLVARLMESVEYEAWRLTPQFQALNGGLVNTLAEFRHFAVPTPESREVMPQRWEDFVDIRTKMVDALYGMVAPRTGMALVEAMKQRIRERTLPPQWQQALFLMKWVVVNRPLGNEGIAEMYLARLLDYLAANAEAFPEYVVPDATARERKNQAVMNFL